MTKLDWEKANRRDRDRRTWLDGVADPVLLGRVIKLKWPGRCRLCGRQMPRGQAARWSPDGWVEHVDCGARFLEEFDPAGSPE